MGVVHHHHVAWPGYNNVLSTDVNIIIIIIIILDCRGSVSPVKLVHRHILLISISDLQVFTLGDNECSCQGRGCIAVCGTVGVLLRFKIFSHCRGDKTGRAVLSPESRKYDSFVRLTLRCDTHNSPHQQI